MKTKCFNCGEPYQGVHKHISDGVCEVFADWAEAGRAHAKSQRKFIKSKVVAHA